MAPCILLGHLDMIYHINGAAQAIVTRQLSALYTMAMAKEIYNPSVLDTAASSFLSSNGMRCSMYGMMAYFGGYMTDYKQSTALFDISDILRSFKTRFMPVWSRLQEKPASKSCVDSTEQTGKAAMWSYLRREYVAKGRSIRESALYSHGYISEKDVKAIETGEELEI